jgi:hypothetical protein
MNCPAEPRNERSLAGVQREVPDLLARKSGNPCIKPDTNTVTVPQTLIENVFPRNLGQLAN